MACAPTDVSDDESVRLLVDAVERRFGPIDVVLNNATFAPAGTAVVDTPVEVWDRSYAVNLRGPALLARACLPGMIARRHGAFVCVSSTAGPFLAAYESLKSAQLALANALDAELDGTGVVAFTIGPGLVPTPTAVAAVARLAPRLGMTVEGVLDGEPRCDDVSTFPCWGSSAICGLVPGWCWAFRRATG